MRFSLQKRRKSQSWVVVRFLEDNWLIDPPEAGRPRRTAQPGPREHELFFRARSVTILKPTFGNGHALRGAFEYVQVVVTGHFGLICQTLTNPSAEPVASCVPSPLNATLWISRA